MRNENVCCLSGVHCTHCTVHVCVCVPVHGNPDQHTQEKSGYVRGGLTGGNDLYIILTQPLERYAH